MYMGQYFHNLDAKGRVIMPSRFREELGDTFVVAKGYEGCLAVYSEVEWQKFADRIMQMPSYNADARRLARIFSSGAANCETDKQGRILLPTLLREHAHIEKEVVIIGAFDHVEIWDTASWDKYNNDEEALSLEDAAAKLSGMDV